jgi:hypothetical protein
VSLILDNYYYFSEFGRHCIDIIANTHPDDFIKIYEYNFRINKKWLNYYIFSE